MDMGAMLSMNVLKNNTHSPGGSVILDLDTGLALATGLALGTGLDLVTEVTLSSPTGMGRVPLGVGGYCAYVSQEAISIGLMANW